MRLKTLRLPDSGPLMAIGYLLLWLLLWMTVQPYWMLPYGLRFGALLVTPEFDGVEHFGRPRNTGLDDPTIDHHDHLWRTDQ